MHRIVLEGALESVTEKKIPLFIRILAALIILGVCLGLGGCLLYIGIVKKDRMITGIAVFLFLMVMWVIVRKYKEIRC